MVCLFIIVFFVSLDISDTRKELTVSQMNQNHKGPLKRARPSITGREFKLPRNPTERRRTSILDYDLSKFQHNKDQRDSFPLEYCPSITPTPADSTKHKSEKKVVFNLDNFYQIAKAESSTGNLEFSKRIMSQEIVEDAVKYSLEHKDDLFQEFSSFLQCEEFLETEPSTPISLLAGDVISESSKSDKKPSAAVFLRGTLEQTGPSENHVFVVKAKKPPTSKKASLGDTPKQDSSEDVWPWPWLNPEVKSRTLYKSAHYNRITFHYQSKLPKIPLPILDNTLHLFLQSVKPLVTPKVFETTEKVAKVFATGEGKDYHENLVNTCSLSNTIWIKEFLPNYSHCYTRLEALHLNTAIVAPFMYDLWPEKPDSQLSRAAIIIELAVEFWQLIKDERLLPISISRDGQTACMHDFRKLFSSVKLPGIPSDEIFYYFHSQYDELPNPRHIVVLYKGQIFSMEVVDQNFTRLLSDDFVRRLGNIVKSVDDGVCEEGTGLGILTSLDRNEWSEIREYLKELSLENQACLNEIEKAMFVLSLDHDRVCDMDRLPHEAIFGNGYNRWYDKSLSFNVYKNGFVTASVNSSILEGSTAAFLLHYMHLRILEDSEKWDDDVLMSISGCSLDTSLATNRREALFTKANSQASVLSNMVLVGQKLDSLNKIKIEGPMMCESRFLAFDTDENLLAEIEDAKLNFLDLSSSIRIAVCRFEDYERDIFHLKSINTDAFAHLVMQLAYFRMHYRPASVGSKISLRRFHFGRYEIVRTTTSEVVTWCKTMLDPQSSHEDRSYHFLRAENKHISLLNNAFSGRGCGNHLAALRVIAEDVFSTTPNLFMDKGFRQAGGFGFFHIYAECLGVGCTSCPVVWPTSPVGYGIGYFVANCKIVFNVTSWEDECGTSAELFAITLKHTLKDMHEFLRRL